jgi:hypothetical protein
MSEGELLEENGKVHAIHGSRFQGGGGLRRTSERRMIRLHASITV